MHFCKISAIIHFAMQYSQCELTDYDCKSIFNVQEVAAAALWLKNSIPFAAKKIL